MQLKILKKKKQFQVIRESQLFFLSFKIFFPLPLWGSFDQIATEIISLLSNFVTLFYWKLVASSIIVCQKCFLILH